MDAEAQKVNDDVQKVNDGGQQVDAEVQKVINDVQKVNDGGQLGGYRGSVGLG